MTICNWVCGWISILLDPSLENPVKMVLQKDDGYSAQSEAETKAASPRGELIIGKMSALESEGESILLSSYLH